MPKQIINVEECVLRYIWTSIGGRHGYVSRGEGGGLAGRGRATAAGGPNSPLERLERINAHWQLTRQDVELVSCLSIASDQVFPL